MEIEFVLWKGEHASFTHRCTKFFTLEEIADPFSFKELWWKQRTCLQQNRIKKYISKGINKIQYE